METKALRHKNCKDASSHGSSDCHVQSAIFFIRLKNRICDNLRSQRFAQKGPRLGDAHLSHKLWTVASQVRKYPSQGFTLSPLDQHIRYRQIDLLFLQSVSLSHLHWFLIRLIIFFQSKMNYVPSVPWFLRTCDFRLSDWNHISVMGLVLLNTVLANSKLGVPLYCLIKICEKAFARCVTSGIAQNVLSWVFLTRRRCS